jgi:hypothetical protein
MEHDPGRMPHNELAQETVHAVRCALERYANQPGDGAPFLRAALHDLAREARLIAMPPEQLLVVLKHTWQGLPQVVSAPDQSEQTRILQSVVTMCIKEYFAE